MAALYTNNASTTLASGITNSATSLTVTSGNGAKFPNPTGSDYFMCTLQGASGSPIEIVKVTARSTDTFTIVRAQEGTTASAFSANDIVELRVTAGEMTNLPQLNVTNTFSAQQTFSSGIKFGDSTTMTTAPVALQFGGQSFTSNGTFTIPTGVTALKVTVVGGGGGGGNNGSSGGAGGQAISYLTGLTPSNTIAVTVGAAGTAGIANNAAGGSGGTSSVASGTQAITTVTCTGGAGSASGSNQNVIVAGGTATNGSININGAAGALYGGSTMLGNGGIVDVNNTSSNAVGYGSGGYGQAYGTSGGVGRGGIVIFEW